MLAADWQLSTPQPQCPEKKSLLAKSLTSINKHVQEEPQSYLYPEPQVLNHNSQILRVPIGGLVKCQGLLCVGFLWDLLQNFLSRLFQGSIVPTFVLNYVVFFLDLPNGQKEMPPVN